MYDVFWLEVFWLEHYLPVDVQGPSRRPIHGRGVVPRCASILRWTGWRDGQAVQVVITRLTSPVSRRAETPLDHSLGVAPDTVHRDSIEQESAWAHGQWWYSKVAVGASNRLGPKPTGPSSTLQ